MIGHVVCQSVRPSVRLSVCNAVHCCSQGWCSVFLEGKFLFVPVPSEIFWQYVFQTPCLWSPKVPGIKLCFSDYFTRNNLDLWHLGLRYDRHMMTPVSTDLQTATGTELGQ